MAYKFQIGQAILSGALAQEGKVEIKDDGGTLKGTITTAGVVSGSGALQGASVAVDGGVTAAGALSGSSATVGSIALAGTAVTSTAAELNLVDGSSAGTVVNSKAVIYGGSGQVIASSISASAQLEGLSLSVAGPANVLGVRIDDGSEIGTDSDTDMITLNNGSDVTIASDLELRVGSLTNGRVATVGTNSALADHSNFTFASDVLGVPGVSASANISASAFYGDGSNITGITADTIDVTASTANTNYELVFVGDLGSDKKLGGYAGLTFNPDTGGNGANMEISGSKSGKQSAVISFGDQFNYIGREPAGPDEVFAIYSDKAIDISGSGTGGILLFAGHGAQAGVSVQGAAGFQVMNENEDVLVTIDGTNGHVSSSGDGRFFALDINGTEAISSARAGALTSLAVSDLTDNRVLIAGTSGEVEDSANLTFDGSTLSVTGEISGSGNLQAGGSVKLQGLGSATVDLTADLMIIDDGASGDIKTTSLANYATALAAGANEGLSSTAGRLAVDLNDLVAGDFTHGSWYNSTIAFVDVNDSNATKKESLADLVTKIAGAGLTATNGVLSTQAGAVTAATGGGDLSEGYNFLTGALGDSEAFTVKLPSGSNGDVVVVKAQAMGAGAKVVINRSGSQTIDGETSIELESPYAAVSLVYVTDNDWRIV